ncbi:MAG: methyltransferase [Dongiaceae bacterium]
MNAIRTLESQNNAATATLRQMILSFRVTQMIHVAAKLQIADRLADAPQTAGQLAGATGAEPRALYRLLRALAAVGIFRETGDGAFALTPVGRTLRKDAAGSLHGMALLYGEEWLWQAYGRMHHSVQTGQPAFDEVHGEPLFDFLMARPEAAAVFNGAMSSFSHQEADAILAAYDFSGVGKVIDVGGGDGTLAVALLRRHAQLTGLILDLPMVVEEAERKLSAAGLSARSACTSGDFFESVPKGGDIYLLKNIIHDWRDAQAMLILRNCRRAMRPDSRLLLAERIIAAGSGAAEAKLFDISMMVVAGGQERTESEHRAILAAAGLELVRVIPTQSPLSLIEAAPVAD